jgi:hypothetical protein
MNVALRRGVLLATFVWTLATLLSILNAWSAGPGDRACFIEDHRGARGDLENGQRDVLSRVGRFDYGSMQYRFEALSLWGFDEPNADKTCLRYEIKNLSGEKIERVIWKDAGILFMDINKGGRARWTAASRPPYPAVQDTSEIKAFAKSSDSVRAYLPVKRAAASTGPTVDFTEFDIRSSMPDAATALDRANLPNRSVAAVGPQAISDQRGFLRTQFNNGTLAFEHVSAARYEGQTVSVTQSIKLFSRILAEISAPYISALSSLKAPVNADAITQFAITIAEMKGQWSRPTDFWDKSVRAPVASGAAALFIVQYPVTVRAEGAVLCLFVTAYSPIPVEAEDNYCATQR